MIKLIVGKKGSGKTKTLINHVNEAAKSSKGNVVCIEKGNSLKFDLNYQIRLINIEEYKISGTESYYGFIAGLLAGNYDITEIFADATFKILCGKGENDFEALTKFIDGLDKLTKESGPDITFTVSCAEDEMSEHLKSFIEK